LRPVDLQKVAQSVGKTSRYTCGSCHYYGGHGNGVKHGDLDTSLEAPDRETDVHMDALGLDFTCSTCHRGSGHTVAGSRFQMSVMRAGPLLRGMVEDRNPASCESCHGNEPHSAKTMANIKPLKGYTPVSMAVIVNNHGAKLACQTCHIPAMARGGVATKLMWDWSQAGKMGTDGKPMVIKDDKGHVIYDSKRGAFTVAENVIPNYVWFNGEVRYTTLGDTVEKSEGFVKINRFMGGPTDGKSRIWPVKIYRGVQPYDPVNKTLVIPKTYAADDKDMDSYFNGFNWGRSVAAGMAEVGAPFSGKVDFIKTEMLWPITHMVAPKEKTLGCKECHNRNGGFSGGRLKDLPGLKMVQFRLD
jgi:octaheme c-type cytochrome (tetrathionate reductase family)